MEKEQNQSNNKSDDTSDIVDQTKSDNDVKSKKKEEPKEKSPEEIIVELEDKLARTFAEMENQRRRFEKEKEEAYEYGGFAFAKEALNLIDNLDRSKQILLNDQSLKNSDVLNKAIEHFDIIYKDLISIFEKNNIKSIESLNKKLDPNFHQAMMEIEDDQKEAGTIVQEIQKGFTIKDRLLRPSLGWSVKKDWEKRSKKSEKQRKFRE